MRFNVTSIKERIAIGEQLTPDERDFVLDCINEATSPAATARHDPGNYLRRIEHIWAFLSVDAGGEGVCAAPIGGMTLPLIAADEQRLAALRPAAQFVADEFKKIVRLAKFSTREDIEVLNPHRPAAT